MPASSTKEKKEDTKLLICILFLHSKALEDYVCFHIKFRKIDKKEKMGFMKSYIDKMYYLFLKNLKELMYFSF